MLQAAADPIGPDAGRCGGGARPSVFFFLGGEAQKGLMRWCDAAGEGDPGFQRSRDHRVGLPGRGADFRAPCESWWVGGNPIPENGRPEGGGGLPAGLRQGELLVAV